MMIRAITLLLLLWMIRFLPAQPIIDSHFELVRGEFSGENAYATTSYVEQYFRLPGNSGFDSSIYYVQNILGAAGFKPEAAEPESRMTYRIERIPMDFLAWEPLSATLHIVGNDQPLLDFKTNRNMICINSHATPREGIKTELVNITHIDDLKNKDVAGKIVMADGNVGQLFYQAVIQQKALGVLAYSIPSYNQPEKYKHSIPFRSIPQIKNNTGWAISLSYHAREQLLNALEQGRVELEVNIQTRIYASTELALIAEIKGSRAPKERFVFSAHVQEPGANDNASGVGCQAEMARVMAELVDSGKVDPARTITFLWGDEIDMTRRYIQGDKERSQNIKWGISLDMVGEDTDKTGGVFLIEKMPDPSAIWTRGDDQHTEWGSTHVSKDDLNPHYFNDLVQYICDRQGEHANWKVSNNPYEGGSDHQPFLDAGIPGLLLWHFTDVFYHTDADRIDKVSKNTLKNVGISATVAALTLCSDNILIPNQVIRITHDAAIKRLKTEFELSYLAIRNDPDTSTSIDKQLDIIRTWTSWYGQALSAIHDLMFEENKDILKNEILKAKLDIETQSKLYLETLKHL